MIGIIGFGRFGKLMTGYLASDYPVKVWNRRDKSEAIRRCGADPAPLSEVCKETILIVAVPISTLRQTLIDIGPFLTHGTTVVDVCSVKIYPVQWMEALLPQDVFILGTHPMFGPDSAADSLLKRKIVLCPVRMKRPLLEKIERYLSSKGLEVIQTTPEDHDRQIAVSLSLTHFIGRSLAEFGAEKLPIDTEGYNRLLHTLEVVTHDTWQLFEDIHRYNPFAAECRTRLGRAMNSIDERLKGLPPIEP
jgi:prephenate dehydrogenase